MLFIKRLPLPKPRALLISPEWPWPAAGGGPMRTAALLHALAASYQLDLMLFREDGAGEGMLPPDLPLGDVVTLRLPRHARSSSSRLLRNLSRAVRGVPPLVDRFAAAQRAAQTFLHGRHYELAVLEHEWLAPWAPLLRPHARRLVLDLHNIDSAYFETLARCLPLIKGVASRFFARHCRAVEERYFPAFDHLLCTSEEDAQRVQHMRTPVTVYPNSIPLRPRSRGVSPQRWLAVMSGNFEYEPNIDAVAWLMQHVWPRVRAQSPQARLRFIGKGEQGIAALIAGQPGVEATGPVEDPLAEIARAELALAPLRAGSGTRLKIVEAWAADVPVLSTTIGAEGLLPTPAVQLADTPEDFAAAWLLLLREPARRAKLADAGRALYEERYTWQATERELRKAGLLHAEAV
jgi:polysaccharide biosynthesis protein PslH